MGVSTAFYIGKSVLAGITYLGPQKGPLAQIQFYGRITHINEKGIFIKRADTGSDYVLPPDFKSLKPAPAGEYRLRSTGEVVVDPDFTTSWTITKGPPEDTSK